MRSDQSLSDGAGDGEGQIHVERAGSYVENGLQVGPVDIFHGHKGSFILGILQVARMDDIAGADLAQGVQLMTEAGGEGFVQDQLQRQEPEGAQLVQEDMVGQVDRAEAALAQLMDDAVGFLEQPAGLEVVDPAEFTALDRGGVSEIGIAVGAERALFHAITLTGLRLGELWQPSSGSAMENGRNDGGGS